MITVTEEYIAIWSTLSGSEVKRYKNVGFKEIVFWNHSCFFLFIITNLSNRSSKIACYWSLIAFRIIFNRFRYTW